MKNTRLISIVLALILSFFTVKAQIVVEDDIVTDSIDVFSGSTQPSKSRTVASMTSLILPGLGHQYLGNGNRAMVYYSAEALFVCSMIFLEKYSRRMFKNSESYAWMYAGAAAGSDASDYYWQNVGRFMDSDEYNRIMELNRTPEDKYNENESGWRWIDDFFRNEYVGLRETATRFHVVSTFFIAAMVVNRVVSFVDIRRSTRYKGVSGRSSLLIIPQYDMSGNKIGFSVQGHL